MSAPAPRSDGMLAGALHAPGGSDASVSEVADQAYDYVREQLARGVEQFPRLASFSDSVCLKNSHGVLVFSNETHRRTFTPQASPIGRTSHAYLDPIMADRAESMERLLLGGCPYVECEHSGPGPDGSMYRMVAHKRSLSSLNAPGFAILGVIRLLARSPLGEGMTHVDLARCCTKFRELADRDQEICRLTALGISSRELGERLGMTTRGIELRKQKAFAHLGVAKAVDLARLLTRLQDRGHLDLGL